MEQNVQKSFVPDINVQYVVECFLFQKRCGLCPLYAGGNQGGGYNRERYRDIAEALQFA